MRTPRLRLSTKKLFYARMLLGLLNVYGAPNIQKTEAMIASYTKARHAILISMGRMAVFEGLRALNRTGEIILSPINVPEVVSLIIRAGFTPVFCDTEPGTWNIDVSKAEHLITDKTVAIMSTHFYGNMNTAFPIHDLCMKHRLLMIEDAAQAVGVWKDGKHAGTIGDFGILSFSYPKNVTSFYGGCLLTDNDDIAHRVRSTISTYPKVSMRWLYKKVLVCAIIDMATFAPVFQLVSRVVEYGYGRNIRWIMGVVTQNLNASLLVEIPNEYVTQMSPQQAKIIADKWQEVDEDVLHRIQCAEIYYEHLKNVDGLICTKWTGDRSHAFHYVPIQVADKYALQRFMIEHHCDVAIQHAPNCADLPAYKPYYRDCPIARAACAGTVMLPTYRDFPLAQAHRYAELIGDFCTA